VKSWIFIPKRNTNGAQEPAGVTWTRADGTHMRSTCHSRPSLQKCEPSFGAIPSAADRQKKQDEQAEADEKRDDILAGNEHQRGILSKEALQRLIEFEQKEPEKADSVKDKLVAERGYWRLNGPVSDSHIKGMIDASMEEKAAVASSESAPPTAGGRGVVLDRRRFGDDSDSDIDLDGL
jgi:DNA-binding TFAR19-related protein (PDSD5 family)